MTVLGLGGKPINWSNPPKPTDKVMWSKKTTSGKNVIGSFRTIAHLDMMNAKALKRWPSSGGIRVMQGPYNTTVTASAGTHDLDACADVEIPGVSWSVQQWFFRQNGAGAYWRNASQGFVNHIHYFVLPPYSGAEVSKGYMDAGFKVGYLVDGGWSTRGRAVGSSQIKDYYEHKNALASHAHDPSQFPSNIRNTIFNLEAYVQAKSTDYHWFQPGKLGSAESGCVLGVRKSFGTLTQTVMIKGSSATSEGGGIRMRPILRGVAKSKANNLQFPNAAGHAPPPRAPKSRAAYTKKFAKVPARFKGADMNLTKRLTERALGRSVAGSGVLYLTLPKGGWKVLSNRAVDVGGDHKAVLVVAQHKKTKTKVRFLVINAMSVSAGKAKSSEIFARGLRFNPDIVMGSECADFRAVRVDAAN